MQHTVGASVRTLTRGHSDFFQECHFLVTLYRIQTGLVFRVDGVLDPSLTMHVDIVQINMHYSAYKYI